MYKVQSDSKLAQDEIEKLERRLAAMCTKLGFYCTQVNGQRVCTSIRYSQKPNVKGTEIFIGKIPRKIFEDELIPLFLRAGELYQFRLMLNFSLKNRGFAFATYTTVEGAERAIALFDNFEISRNARIGVFKSVDNCRLFFGNIPQEYSKGDIAKILKDNSIEGVSDIIMYKDLLRPELNRGYVFVEFSSHRDAAMAKKQLYPGCLIVEGQSVFVDWADPIPDVDSKVMAKVTKLFLHHLPVDLSKEELSNAIARCVDPKTILKVHKQLNYAFVHFFSRDAAEYAKQALKDLPFPDVVIEWARPRQYSKQQRLESPPTHFCLSLPPKMRRHYQQYINSLICETSSNDSLKSSSNNSTTRSWNKIDRSSREIMAAKTNTENSYAILKNSMSMSPKRETEHFQSLLEKEMVKKLENMNVQTFPLMPQSFNGFSRPQTPIGSSNMHSTIRQDEAPRRNPLIGLPITLLPTRRNTPSPLIIPERPKYNDVMFPNSSMRSAFYQPFFNNNSYSSNETRFQNQAIPPMMASGRSTPGIQNHMMPNAYKSFEFF